MTVMYSFCFWFSVRLGSIIVGVACIVQSTLALIACGIGMNDLTGTSTQINYWLQTNDFMLAKDFFSSMRDDPGHYLTWLISALTVYLCSCILLIYGAFKCNLYLMIPFILLDLLRLIALTFLLILVMLLIKRNTLSLGLIIGASVVGVFTMLYLWYEWFCTVALAQIIREIQNMNSAINQQLPGETAKTPYHDNNMSHGEYAEYQHRRPTVQRYDAMTRPAM